MPPRSKRKQSDRKHSGQPKGSKPDSSNFIVELVGGVSDSDNERNVMIDEIRSRRVSLDAESSDSTNVDDEEENEQRE